jgi:uncharacterized DUF497 family protein
MHNGRCLPQAPHAGTAMYIQKALLDPFFVHTISAMEITFDPAKNAHNITARGLSFYQVRDFDFNTARIALDERRDYGEARFVALGYLGGRLHVLCFTETTNGIRVISLRKANQREEKLYAKTLAAD